MLAKPLIPSSLSEELTNLVPMMRTGPAGIFATAYVMSADPLSSYVSGATIAVTDGKPIL
jgi:NAD(P)-dependent dehydrogenase (short-subunit alcohol dehydrogenase family)